MDLIYWSYRSYGWVKVVEGGLRYLASCEHHFLRVHENLVQYPSNNISFPKITIRFLGNSAEQVLRGRAGIPQF